MYFESEVVVYNPGNVVNATELLGMIKIMSCEFHIRQESNHGGGERGAG